MGDTTNIGGCRGAHVAYLALSVAAGLVPLCSAPAVGFSITPNSLDQHPGQRTRYGVNSTCERSPLGLSRDLERLGALSHRRPTS